MRIKKLFKNKKQHFLKTTQKHFLISKAKRKNGVEQKSKRKL